MPITHEDITELKKVFDDRYVLQCDCSETQEKISNRFSNDNTRIELLISRQNTNNWLTTAIASGIIALLIKVFIGG